MVHNGIEYGIMAAYAEGLGVLRSADIGTENKESMPRPRHYVIRNIISTSLTYPISAKYGDAAA
jgi:6-phosphogluconate dehydrogenase (decarboxylating)